MEVRLSKWQDEVRESGARFKVINVGRRAGKTVLAVLEMITKAGVPGSVVWYVSPTYSQSKNIAWSLLKKYVPPAARAEFNESELKCKLHAYGSEIHLKGADNPDSLRGTTINFIVFDEVAFFKDWKSTWAAIRPILIDSGAGGWFISTPNGFNHFYELYNLAQADTDYQAFHYTSYDNPYLPVGEIEKTRKDLDESQFRQEILADFTRPAGTVYSDWNVDRFQRIDYEPFLPLHISFDWGVSDPTSVIWLQPSGGEIRVIDYYEASDANIEHFISVINSKPYKPAELYTGDAAGKSRSLQTGTSVIEILASKGIHVRVTDGLKITDQIRVTHGYMPRLYVDSDRCSRFRDCLLNYRYPTKKSSAINQSNEQPIHDEYSHAMRAFEYWCVNYGDIPVSEYEPYLPEYEPELMFGRTGY